MVLDEQQYVRKVLTDYFVLASERNPRFSLRALAKKLGISSSSLSEIIRGKRKVSAKKAREFAASLGLSPQEKQNIQSLFQKQSSIQNLAKISNPFREVVLSPPEFDLLADWRFFAVVALMRTKGFVSDRKWIARRLAISTKEIETILRRLIELGVVHEENGILSESKCSFRTSENYPDDLLRKRQIEGLAAAIKKIESKTEGQTGFYSTISADPKNFVKANEMIEEFLKKLSIYLHTGEPTEVFELQIQLFPRSHPIELASRDADISQYSQKK